MTAGMGIYDAMQVRSLHARSIVQPASPADALTGCAETSLLATCMLLPAGSDCMPVYEGQRHLLLICLAKG